jgi:hypothetical protein
VDHQRHRLGTVPARTQVRLTAGAR